MSRAKQTQLKSHAVFDAGDWLDCSLQNVPRKFHAVHPLSRIGFIRHLCAPQETIDNKLELAIRLASTGEFLEEVQGSRRRRLRYPNVAVKIPGVPHTQAILSPRDAIFLAYDPRLADAFRKNGLVTPPLAWECELTPEIVGPLRQIQQLIPMHKRPGVADQLDLLAMLVWQSLLMQRQSRAQTDDVSAQLRRIVTHLRLHFLEPTDFDRLAEENGWSRRSFFRHWQNHYPVSPAQYVLDLKMGEACRMLRDGDQKIGDIATNLHFEHTEYFCRAFKKKYGLSPKAFREKTMKERFAAAVANRRLPR